MDSGHARIIADVRRQWPTASNVSVSDHEIMITLPVGKICLDPRTLQPFPTDITCHRGRKFPSDDSDRYQED